MFQTLLLPFSQLLTYLPFHVTLTKERKKRNPHFEANEKTGSQWEEKKLDRSWKNKKLKEIERCAIVGVLLLTVWLVWELGSVSYMVLECIKLK